MALDPRSVAVFWDYGNCFVSGELSGYSVVKRIRELLQSYGPIKVFRAYMPHILAHPSLRSELQTSGVSIVDVPRNGRKDVADKMIIVDVLTYAMDNLATNSTIVVISGDRDFAYAISVLRLRQYEVVVMTLPNAHPSLTIQASATFGWLDDILGLPKPPHVLARQLATPAKKGTNPPSPAKDKIIGHPKSRNHGEFSLGAQTREASEESENTLETRVEEAVLTPTSASTSPGLTKIRPPGALLSEILRSKHPPPATPSRTIAEKLVDPSVAPLSHPAGRRKISHPPIPQFEAGLRRFRFPILLQTLFTLYRTPVYQRRDVLPDIVSKFSKRPSKVFANFRLSKMKPKRLR